MATCRITGFGEAKQKPSEPHSVIVETIAEIDGNLGYAGYPFYPLSALKYPFAQIWPL